MAILFLSHEKVTTHITPLWVWWVVIKQRPIYPLLGLSSVKDTAHLTPFKLWVVINAKINSCVQARVWYEGGHSLA